MRNTIFCLLFIFASCVIGQNTLVGTTDGNASVSPTGAAVYSIPIPARAGMSNFIPNISIVYNSQSGNGLLGYGWNISGLSSICSVPNTKYHSGFSSGISLTNNHAYSLDGQRLFVKENQIYGDLNSEYLTEQELYNIIKVTECLQNTPLKFRRQTPDGGIYDYGGSNATCYYNSETAYQWNICYAEDKNGNYIEYNYTTPNEGEEPLISKISFGKNIYKTLNSLTSCSVEFIYENRPDTIKRSIGNQVFYCGKRLAKIVCKYYGNIYRTYSLSYRISNGHFSVLESVQEQGTENSSFPETTFVWNDLPDMEISSTTTDLSLNFDDEPGNMLFFSGDLDNDGCSELIGLASKYERNNNSVHYYTGVNVYRKNPDSENAMVASGKYRASCLLPEEVSGIMDFHNEISHGLVAHICDNYRNSIVLPFYTESSHGKYLKLEFPIEGLFTNSEIMYSSEMPCVQISDFDRDGLDEIIYIERKKLNDNIVRLGQIKVNLSQDTNTPTYYNLDVSSLTTAQKDDKIRSSICGDFNSDGMVDIMLLLNNSSIIFWNTNGIFTDSNFTHYTNIKHGDTVNMGDFNGDGLLDVIFNNTSSSIWGIALNNGDKTFTNVNIPILQSKSVAKTAENDSVYFCMVQDFNGDKSSDIITSYKHNGSQKILWLKSNKNSTFTQVKEVTNSNPFVTKNLHVTQGDFDHDGVMELLSYGFDINIGTTQTEKTWNLYKNTDVGPGSNKLASIIDGLGKCTTFSYNNLQKEYSCDTSLQYPLIPFNLPIPVVGKTETSDNIHTYRTEHYYSDGVIHLQGKGFLGFLHTSTKEDSLISHSGIVLDSVYYTPVVTDEKVEDLEGNEMRHISNVYTISSSSIENAPVHNKCLATTTKVDNTAMINQTITYSDYIYGFPKTIVTEGENTTEQTITYKNITDNGKWVLGLPFFVRTKKCTNLNEPFYEHITNNYNAHSQLFRTIKYVSTESFSSLKSVRTETLTRDSCGHVIKEKIRLYKSTDDLVTQYKYDDIGQLIEEVTPKGHKTTYNYDATGMLLSSSDDFNKTDFYYYDGMGRNTMMIERYISADNIVKDVTTEYIYDTVEDPAIAYMIKTVRTNNPTKTNYYDAFGREVMSGTVHYDGNEYLTQNKYSSLHLVDSISEPYRKGLSPNTFTTMRYDPFSRLKWHKDPMGRITQYVYSPQQRKSQNYAGGNVTEIFDKDGRIKRKEETPGSIIYTYNSAGDYSELKLKPNSSIADPTDLTYTYDSYSRMSSVSDATGATKYYTYDKWGNVDTIKTSNGLCEYYKYNKFGEIEERGYISENGEVTKEEYLYNDKHQLIDISGDKSHYTYEYDINGRLLKESVEIITLVDTSKISHEYTYDYGDRVISKKSLIDNVDFPIIENYTYTNGHLTAVNVNDSLIWQLSSEDNFGRINVVNDLYGQQNYVYDVAGNVISHTSSGICAFTHSYSYDNKGNLACDNGVNVEYDTKNRIKKWGNQRYSYDVWGNITKEGYQNDVIYDNMQLLEVVNPNVDYWGESFQSITYNHRSQPLSIGDAFYRYVLEYDTRGNRIASYRYNNRRPVSDGSLIQSVEPAGFEDVPSGVYILMEARAYVGDCYETYASRNGQKHHLYYAAGSSSTAKAVLDITEDTIIINRLYRDWQGSVIARAEGRDTTFYYDYDPWGRYQTNDTTHVYPNESSVFNRGYLGQEHISCFGFINLNARLYDPVSGRFLSPDPVINTDGRFLDFNCYTYCHNNPFTYVDPNGESAVLALCIGGALIGGTINLVQNWDNINGFGDGFSYFVTGAAVGTLSAVAATCAPAGILGGALYGAGVGAVSGGLLNGTNTYLAGGDFWDGANTGFWNGFATGAITGGITGGVDAYFKGANVWTGKHEPAVWSYDIAPKVLKNGVEVHEHSFVPDESYSTMTSHQKGEYGVSMALERFKFDKYYTEVSFRVDGVVYRADIVGIKGRNIDILEIKTGVSVEFTKNQRIALPLLQKNVPIEPFGGNASIMLNAFETEKIHIELNFEKSFSKYNFIYIHNKPLK